MSVFDSSALLAFLQDEHGADVVEAALQSGGLCGAANWSEVAQKIISHERNWDLARALLISFDLHVEPVSAGDAEWAARRWRPGEGLALADRLCLALGSRTGGPVWTADAQWGTEGDIHQIR